jgi:hypothetical protein
MLCDMLLCLTPIASHRHLIATAFATWVSLLLTLPAAAQQTRAGVIADAQAGKAAALGTEGPGRGEILTTRIASRLLAGPPVGPYPWLGSVLDGQGLAAGAGYRRPLGDRLMFGGIAGLSVRRATLLEARADLPGLAGGHIDVGAVLRRVRAPSVAFFGLGPDSGATRHTYQYAPTSAGIEMTTRPARGVTLGAGYERLSVGSPGDGQSLAGFDVLDTPGVTNALDYHVARLRAGADWRPAPAYSVRGGYARATWSHYREAEGRPYGFSQQEIEAAQLVPLAGEHIVLAFRALGTFTNARGGDEVPFVLAPYLGSGSTLRGFSNRRFRDTHRLLLTAEYRWMPSRYLDMAVFVDRGQVAPTLEAFRWRAFEQSIGVGARFHGPSFNVLRIELARGREGFALGVSTTQPF